VFMHFWILHSKGTS